MLAKLRLLQYGPPPAPVPAKTTSATVPETAELPEPSDGTWDQSAIARYGHCRRQGAQLCSRRPWSRAEWGSSRGHAGAVRIVQPTHLRWFQ